MMIGGKKYLVSMTCGALALVLAASGVQAQPLDTRSAAPAAAELERLPSFADLVEKVSPAVVSIRVAEERAARAPANVPDLPFPPGSPFERFFRDLQPQDPGGAPRGRQGMALGSGFIISADGYIVTNNHVVGDGKNITVVRNDGSELPAKLIGRDPKTDLALVKVEGKDLPYVAFGDSDEVRVGDWVLAVGNPFGLGGTVTTGIVSARGREIGAGPYDDFIQIDASINRGNSGGPTFDVRGNVIGVNTAIFSPTGGSVGIGFAIPSSIAQKVVAQLQEDGKVTRGWLGVTIQQVDSEMAASLALDKPKGALVAQVADDSPAKKAGVQIGDVILNVDGKEMEDVRSVSRTVAELKPDTRSKLVVWRDGRSRTLTADIGTFPDTVDVAAATPDDTPAPGTTTSLGLALTETPDGVVVQSVDPASDAAEKGVRPGDVIVKVSGKDVKRTADVVAGVEAASKADKSSVLLLLRSDEQQRFVALSLSKS